MRGRKAAFFLAGAVLFAVAVHAGDDILNGFALTRAGEVFEYHSPDPGVSEALLVRSQDAARFIEWDTEAVPAGFSGKQARFAWLFGIAVRRKAGHTFVLSLNGEPLLRFANPLLAEKKAWTVKGRDGAGLEFHPTLIDRYGDQMGHAVLTVPRRLLKPGDAQRIRVSGESAGSPDWYMTFVSPGTERFSVGQENLVRRDGNTVIQARFFHIGDPLRAQVEVDGGGTQKMLLKPGFNAMRIPVPAASGEREQRLSVRTGHGKAREVVLRIKPVRPWTVYLVQHTHTDIGYTRPQTEILPEHLRYIDYALDFCDATDGYPDDARFRWTCETSWAVREYLKTRPRAQVERLLRRARDGRIEVTGLLLNTSDLCDEASLAAQLQPLKAFREKGIPVRTAMQNDVNGVGWSLIDAMQGSGLRFLVMGQNSHRALKPFDRPTLFWWESPAGNRILAYRNDHYMTGNNLGIHGRDMETVERELPAYLRKLEEKGYPADRVSVQYSGYYTDNSPPATSACDLVRSWNEIYAWPRLRLATAGEFLEEMADRSKIQFPVLRGAWPDWWTDGFGSAALETAYARMTHADLLANRALLAMALLAGADLPADAVRRLEAVQDDLFFYDEHTFGAAESISDPTAENSVVQWGEKAAYAWEAVKKNRLLREEGMGLLQDLLPQGGMPTLVVFNTLNWPRSGLVRVYIDHQLLPRDRKFRIVDESGMEAPAQAYAHREEGSYWAIFVRDVPAMGYKALKISVESGRSDSTQTHDWNGILENRFYRVVIDPVKGAITSILDKEMGRELAGVESQWLLGQFIYEELAGDRHQLERFTLEKYSRTPWSGIEAGECLSGPVWQSATLVGQSPGCADGRGVTCEIRLHREEKRLEFRYAMRKLPVTGPEGAYVAFPFQLPDSRFCFEVQGGAVEAGAGQLEGSATDWTAVQNWAALRGRAGQIVLSSPETPLMQFGAINLGKYRRRYLPEKTHLYSWVLNNYWTTNFRASQEGELKWTYHLTSTSESGDGFASRFGWSTHVPMLVRVLPPGRENGRRLTRSFLSFNPSSLLLVSATPGADGESVCLQLRETEGRPASLALSGWLKVPGVVSVAEVNALGEHVKDEAAEVLFRPRETKFLLLAVRPGR